MNDLISFVSFTQFFYIRNRIQNVSAGKDFKYFNSKLLFQDFLGVLLLSAMGEVEFDQVAVTVCRLRFRMAPCLYVLALIWTPRLEENTFRLWWRWQSCRKEEFESLERNI